MGRKRLATGFCSFIGLIILILDGKTALLGARTGIELCFRTVVPSLFPFFLLSGVLTQSLSGIRLSLLRPLWELLAIPSGAESILIPGFLGGYPAGAQSIGICYQTGKLSRQDAERMLSFCSNAGPSFLFGMIPGMFESAAAPWALWGIHVLSACMVGMVIAGSEPGQFIPSQTSEMSASETLYRAVRIMATVCGWVIIFRVVIAFLNRWLLWLLPAPVQVAVIGLLELSNGCCELRVISDPSLRFFVCSVILSFGGICVAMQTQSVIGNLSMKCYIHGKLLQGAFSAVLSAAFLQQLFPIVSVLLLVTIVIFRKMQKRSSNRRFVGV